jgi:ABC-type glycerol-3-phosphate transport system substrate-binding protein
MPDRSRMRRLPVIVVAIAVAVSLAACAGIPTSGSVTAGNLVNDEVDPVIGFAPQGPRQDSSQEEILADFIAAATNPQSDYDVARQFLAEGFEGKWDPDASTTVRAGVGTVRRDSDTQLSYSLSTSASVDSE